MENKGDFERDLQLAESSEAIFEEWAGGSSSETRKDNIDDEELDLEKVADVPFPRKKGNQRPPTIATCEICGVELKHPSRIKEHMRTHTGEKPFQCDICGVRFTQRTPMVNHYRVQHMGDLPFVCGFGCGKRFVNNSRKNAHELRHIGLKRTGPPRPHLKPVKKLVCPPIDNEQPGSGLSSSATANFVSAPSIANNFQSTPDHQQLATSSNSEVKPSFFLEEDEDSDSSRRINDVISSVLARVLCPPQEEVMLAKTIELPQKRNYMSSRAPTVAQCTICGLMLKHPSKIATHVRTHTGEKPFECGECGMCLTTANSLKVHIRRMHTNERPFNCQFDCGMSFVTESVRREHEMAVHQGVKRYTCVVKGCNASFARRVYLMRHRKNVHGDIFGPVFDNVDVTNEEAADPVIDDKDMFFDAPEEMLLIADEVKMLGHFDDEEFVEEQLDPK